MYNSLAIVRKPFHAEAQLSSGLPRQSAFFHGFLVLLPHPTPVLSYLTTKPSRLKKGVMNVTVPVDVSYNSSTSLHEVLQGCLGGREQRKEEGQAAEWPLNLQL